MSDDLRARLREATPEPQRPVDVRGAWRRGRALRRRRAAARAAAAVALVGAISALGWLRPDPGIELGPAGRAAELPSLAAFERAREADDEVPSPLARRVDAQVDEARRAWSSEEAVVYLLPQQGTADRVCALVDWLAEERAVMGCGPVPGPGQAHVLVERLALPERALVVGVVGDGVEAVQADYRTGEGTRTEDRRELESAFVFDALPHHVRTLDLLGGGSVDLDPLPESEPHAWMLSEAITDSGALAAPAIDGDDATVRVTTRDGRDLEVRLPGGADLAEVAYRSRSSGSPEWDEESDDGPDAVMLGVRPRTGAQELQVELVDTDCDDDLPRDLGTAQVWCAHGWVVQSLHPEGGELPQPLRDIEISPSR